MSQVDRSARATPVLAAFAATLVLGLVLLVAFDPEVQTVAADELVRRQDDARAFLIADFLFVALYAVLSPLVIWRFGRSEDGRWPTVAKGAAGFLVLAGLVDAAENVLLLSATGSVEEGTVDTAHALAVPKVVLFAVGALPALAVNVRAAGARGAPAPPPPGGPRP